MKQITQNIFRITMSIALCIQLIPSCFAQNSTPNSIAQPGDPQRWYTNDTTAHDYYMTLKKEAGAAFQENKVRCNAMERTSRSSCLKEARALFEQDLIDAKQKAQESRP